MFPRSVGAWTRRCRTLARWRRRRIPVLHTARCRVAGSYRVRAGGARRGRAGSSCTAAGGLSSRGDPRPGTALPRWPSGVSPAETALRIDGADGVCARVAANQPDREPVCVGPWALSAQSVFEADHREPQLGGGQSVAAVGDDPAFEILVLTDESLQLARSAASSSLGSGMLDEGAHGAPDGLARPVPFWGGHAEPSRGSRRTVDAPIGGTRAGVNPRLREARRTRRHRRPRLRLRARAG